MKPLRETAPLPARPVQHPDRADNATEIQLSRSTDVRCPICQDAGWLRADVPATHPSFGQIYPCVCKQAEYEQLRADKLRKLSNLDAFNGHQFDEFDTSIPGVRDAYDAALRFAQEPVHQWLLLTGPCGVGKTHLAVAIARFAMDWHRMSVYFAAVPDLLDHLRASFDPTSGSAYDERFSTIRRADLLVLDDLGTENATPWAKEKLYQLINARYSDQMPTVITSNVELRTIDERIASRILDHRLTVHIDIDAADFRRPGAMRRTRSPRR